MKTNSSTDLYEMSDGLFAIRSKVSLDGKTAIEGYFYIDTGSNINLIKPDIVYLSRKIHGDGDVDVTGIGNTAITLRKYRVNISTELQSETNSVVCHAMPITDDWPDEVIGLFGYNYLRQHGLVVDFGRGTMYHNHHGTILGDSQSHSFSTVLRDQGTCRLPIIRLTDDRHNNYDCIIDSGANTNVICQHSVDCGHFAYKMAQDCESIIAGVGSCLESVSSNISVNIIGFAASDGTQQQRRFNEPFEIALSRKSLLPSMEFGKIDALLGIGFLKKNNSIIDCKSGILQIK